MRKILKNQYKRHDIFTCNHSAHHRFGGNVSTYYILSEKECYPEGCINFIWRCRLLNKGHACPKKFTHVGRKCFSCKEYYEEKYCQQPKLKVCDDEYREFLREKEDFDHWVSQYNGREVEIDAGVSAINPSLIMTNGGKKPKFRFNGWILVFESVHVDYDLFDDTAFGWISQKTQRGLQLGRGASFEAKAKFNFERGRLRFNRIHNFEIKSAGFEAPPDINEIMVATQTASRFPVQPDKCIHCPEGVLVDNVDFKKTRNGRRRNLVCLQGVKNPSECIYHLSEILDSEK
ncbi:MAG: hypothetical protein GF310_02455 [candidate division Zixibacteria bacterium]|nr:hypothetical protein [candidate division Zixibacteria bacterium]